jgi:hypothetical protein
MLYSNVMAKSRGPLNVDIVIIFVVTTTADSRNQEQKIATDVRAGEHFARPMKNK